MSEEKTIEIGSHTFTPPFTNDMTDVVDADFNVFAFARFINGAERIADALNYYAERDRHEAERGELAELRARFESLKHEDLHDHAARIVRSAFLREAKS